VTIGLEQSMIIGNEVLLKELDADLEGITSFISSLCWSCESTAGHSYLRIET